MKKILILQRLNKDKNLNIKMEITPKERIKGLVLPNKITPDLAYFCGVLAGDGSIGFQEKKKHYWIKCVGNPKDEKEFYNEIIKPLIKELFNLKINPKLYDGDTTFGFDISSKSMVKYLTEFIGLPLGKKYDRLQIPSLFLNDEKLIRSFICGVADTDFHLAIKRKNYPVIVGVSKSKSFLEEIKKFLEKGGFKTCMYKREGYDIRVNKNIVTYALQISGHNQFLKWIEEIGFKHPKNRKKIDFLMEYKKIAGGGVS